MLVQQSCIPSAFLGTGAEMRACASRDSVCVLFCHFVEVNY